MNSASMIQMPYFFRKRGTGRLLPTNFCTRSLIVAKGQIAHQKRPRNRKMIGMSGHQRTHVSAVPRLSCADSGPSRSWNMISMKSSNVGHWMMPGNHLLRISLSMALICRRLPPARILLFCGLSSVDILFSLYRNGLFFEHARRNDETDVDRKEAPQNHGFGRSACDVNDKVSLKHFTVDMEKYLNIIFAR